MTTAHLSAEETMSTHNEHYDDARLFFGSHAKEDFWTLYKDERKFKDLKSNEAIDDPRFAYLKTCHDLKVFPKARMIIRDTKTSHLEFSSYAMLNKTSLAVSESIKRY